jgi:pectate lyase
MLVRPLLAAATAAALGLTTAVASWPLSASSADGDVISTATLPAGVPAAALLLARQPLTPGDGWASAGTGTTGGSAADDAHISVVHNRAELVAAVTGDVPKIVFVSGRFSMRADANGRPLSCADFADPDYRLDAFLAAYDPGVWGRESKPTGLLEDARVRSAKRQGDQIKINVGSNTTLIGVNGARIEHGSLVLASVGNVIVRNIEFTDAADCFPAWDPTDGEAGNWNSLYDLVSLTAATNVWLDHNTFSDGNNHDADQPLHFGRPYQVHDGATDFIRGSDLITVSWNNYYDHDKTMLIGSTDTPGVDVGKLRVTVHHNRFANVLQRAPRVRFGQVDVFNNAYTATDDDYQYALGVGVESRLHAANNYFVRSADVPDGDLIHYWKGTRITTVGNLVRVGSRPARPVDLVAAYNAAHDPDLTPDAGWTPTLRLRVDPAAEVPRIVNAGAGRHPSFTSLTSFD